MYLKIKMSKLVQVKNDLLDPSIFPQIIFAKAQSNGLIAIFVIPVLLGKEILTFLTSLEKESLALLLHFNDPQKRISLFKSEIQKLKGFLKL